MVEELGKDAQVEFGCEFREGESFEIESGIFEGSIGKLVKKNRQFLWTVEIECMNTVLSVEIDPAEHKMRKLN